MVRSRAVYQAEAAVETADQVADKDALAVVVGVLLELERLDKATTVDQVLLQADQTVKDRGLEVVAQVLLGVMP